MGIVFLLDTLLLLIILFYKIFKQKENNMAKASLIKLLLLLFLLPHNAFSQKNKLPDNQQKLLLRLSSGFLFIVKQSQIDMDSAILSVSRQLQIGRSVLLVGNDKHLLDEQLNTAINGDDFKYLKNQLAQSKGSRHTFLLSVTGALYAFQPGSKQQDMDSAFLYLQKAIAEAKTTQDVNRASNNLCYLGKYYFDKGELNGADSCFTAAIAQCKRTNNKAGEAMAWDFWAAYAPYPGYSLEKKITYINKALELYRQLGQKEPEINILTYLSYIDFALNKLDECKDINIHILELQKAINFPFTHYNTDLLSLISAIQGNHGNHLKYALESIKSIEATGDSVGYAYFCTRVGDVYNELESKKKESLEWYMKSLNKLRYSKDPQLYQILIPISTKMQTLGKAKEVIILVQSILKEYPPVNPKDRQNLFLTLGEGYFNVAEQSLAEKYFKEAEGLQEAVKRTSGTLMNGYIYCQIGLYYFHTKKYEKSRAYLIKAIDTTSPQGLGLRAIAEVHKALFSIDSAAGNYIGAMNHLLKYSSLSDSIYNERESKQTEEFKIQYETEKREQELRLKQENISLLNSKNQLQETNLKKANQARNIIIASALLLLTLLFTGYKIKQRHNIKLQSQQQEINKQNELLKHLIAEQKKLLDEKEWLVKEIHHRVKNNLQIVMSLLNSQTAYLKDDVALDAIRESQNRVHAISLIHQKLYQSDNMAIIDMADYVREVSDYLAENFDALHHIKFNVSIEHIQLDVAQAVPLGLIINEAVTNSVKYAFPDERNGDIKISMWHSSANEIVVMIQDNGIGLLPNFDWQHSKSLGMSLMKGLCKQLDGQFEIINNNGLTVQMKFMPDKTASGDI
jgi:two-component system, sensor histidine kinase PdtaS